MKINNTQRGGMVRQLEAIRKQLESIGRPWYSYTKWGGYDGDDNPEAKAIVAELEKKHQISFLQAEEKRIDKAIETAVDAISKDLKRFNAEKDKERKQTLTQITIGIRDIWAAETVEDAKAIVERFVK